MKIDAVLARHPWPWITWSPDEGSWWEVRDANDGVVFDDGSSMCEYGYASPRMTYETILELVAAHVARSTTQATHSEECWRWHHGCAVARIEALPRAEGDHG